MARPGLAIGATGDVDRALATLDRGSHFLGLGLGSGAAPARAIAGRYRAKVIGNGLRELDRFLNLLIDALAARHCIGLPRGERNTANKLARLRALLGVPDGDHARLTALGRTRDCLFHCGGHVRRGDARGDGMMTIGWPAAAGGTLLRVAVGGELQPDAAQLLETCGYYREIAAALLIEARVPGSAPA